MKVKENIKGKGRGIKKSSIAIAAVLAVLAFALSACAGRNADSLNGGWLYSVQAADGSGQVAVYNGARSSADIVNTVPDGTEMETVNGELLRNDRVAMRYEGQRVYVNRADIGGEGTPTEAAIAAETAAQEAAVEAEKMAARRRPINIITGLIVIAVLALCWFIFTNKIKKGYADYYAEKRKAYPWLLNWIQEHGDPEETRAQADLSGTRLVPIAVAVVGFVAGKLLLSKIILIFIKEGSVFHNTTTVSLIITAVLTLLAFWFVSTGAGDPQLVASKYNGLTLECPECGCPHAWALTAHNIVLTNVDIGLDVERVTTTRKGYGSDDFIESALQGFQSNGSTTKTTVTKRTEFEGIEADDFVCDNCNHTGHTEKRFFDVYKKKINAADDLCFDKESPFRKGGATESKEQNSLAQYNLVKWADNFAALVKAKGAKAGLPAGEIKELLERTAEYTGTYESMEYLDSEAAGEYYRSYIREFVCHYFREAPDDVRAMFGILPSTKLYAWKVDDKAAEAKKK